MGRPPMTINPAWAENVRTVCREEGITQTQLAEKIHLSQQTISKIAQGKASLTEQTAKLIIKLFPKYRFQWLMGYEDYKTDEELKINLLLDQACLEMDEGSATMPLLALHGYKEVKKERGKERTQTLVTIEDSCGVSCVVDSKVLHQAYHDISWYAKARFPRLFEEQGEKENG